MVRNPTIVEEILAIIHSNSGYLRIKVTPNAPKTIFKEVLADEHKTVKVAIHAAPEKGKANEVLIKYLNKTFPSYKAEILGGHTNPIKLIRFNNYND